MFGSLHVHIMASHSNFGHVRKLSWCGPNTHEDVVSRILENDRTCPFAVKHLNSSLPPSLTAPPPTDPVTLEPLGDHLYTFRIPCSGPSSPAQTRRAMESGRGGGTRHLDNVGLESWGRGRRYQDADGEETKEERRDDGNYVEVTYNTETLSR